MQRNYSDLSYYEKVYFDLSFIFDIFNSKNPLGLKYKDEKKIDVEYEGKTFSFTPSEIIEACVFNTDNNSNLVKINEETWLVGNDNYSELDIRIKLLTVLAKKHQCSIDNNVLILSSLPGFYSKDIIIFYKNKDGYWIIIVDDSDNIKYINLEDLKENLRYHIIAEKSTGLISLLNPKENKMLNLTKVD